MEYQRKLINKKGETVYSYESDDYREELVMVDQSVKLEKRYEVLVYQALFNKDDEDVFMGKEEFKDLPTEAQILFTLNKYK